MQSLGIAVGLIFVLLLLFSGGVALISPVRWFALPHYLSLRGSVSKTKLDTFWGRLEVRLLGCVLIATVLFMAASLIPGLNRWVDTMRHSKIGRVVGRLLGSSIFALALSVFFCLGLGSLGTMMLVKPQWYFDKYLKSADLRFIGQEHSTWPDWLVPRFLLGIRVCGIIWMVVAGWAAVSVVPRYLDPNP
jgi:hypothetical protein